MRISKKLRKIISIAVLIGTAMLICSCTEKTYADGSYTIEVSIEGGSGRASVTTPAPLTIEDGLVNVKIEWSSPYYDYMILDDETYYPVNDDGNSVFLLPVTLGQESLEVVADTTAMSQPYEINYVLTFDWNSLVEASYSHTDGAEAENEYAEGFSVIKYDDGCRLITIDDEKFLIREEGCSAVEDGAVIIEKNPENIYAASSSVPDLFRAIDALENIKCVSTESSDWYIEDIKNLMDGGDIEYIGKYSAPDYEKLLALKVSLAIENTMIYHSPEIKEEIEKLGINVIVEKSSYESHPLGRLEWIKLYGIILDKEEEAESFFTEEVQKVENLETAETDGKSVAFFYVTSNGIVNVRKSGDYIPKMIEMAGGSYVLDGLTGDDNALSTMNMDMESFYDAAKDADIIIYNSTITGELSGVDDLLALSSVFADFKAVQEGNVWCMPASTFQQTTAIGEMILDFNKVITGSEEELSFLKKLDEYEK